MSLFTDAQINDAGLVLSIGGALSEGIGSYASAVTLQNNLLYRSHVGVLNAGIDKLNAASHQINAQGLEVNARADELNSYMAQKSAGLAEMGRQNAIAKGQTEQAQLTLQAGNLEATQKAEMASNGIDIGEGSAATVQASTQLLTAMDKNQIAANAMKEAFGYSQQIMSFNNEAMNSKLAAGNSRLEAENQRLAATGENMQAATDMGQANLDRVAAKGVSPGSALSSSLLGSAGNVMGNWYQYKAMRAR